MLAKEILRFGSTKLHRHLGGTLVDLTELDTDCDCFDFPARPAAKIVLVRVTLSELMAGEDGLGY